MILKNANLVPICAELCEKFYLTKAKDDDVQSDVVNGAVADRCFQLNLFELVLSDAPPQFTCHIISLAKKIDHN